jgi:uncharacterized membrane protein YkoI
MSLTRIAAAGAALMMISGSVVAQTAAQTPGQMATAPAAPGTVGLSQAIQTAEQATQGRVFEADREARDGQPVYELELIDGAEDVHEVVVDAGTGEVLSRDEQTIEGVWQRWLNGDEMAAVTGADRSLAEIVAAVEAETGGTVREASIDSQGDRVVYKMELDGAGGGELEVEVDPSTGEILRRDDD